SHLDPSARRTNLVLTGSLCAARRIASRASDSGTPANSNITRPGLTTATQPSGAPLPEPIRVSAGFFVTGLSGNTLIQTLPPRLILRVIAILAASIWRFVSQPCSSDFSPYSPNCTFTWPREEPRRRPRCCLRCFTRLGESISVALRIRPAADHHVHRHRPDHLDPVHPPRPHPDRPRGPAPPPPAPPPTPPTPRGPRAPPPPAPRRAPAPPPPGPPPGSAARPS